MNYLKLEKDPRIKLRHDDPILDSGAVVRAFVERKRRQTDIRTRKGFSLLSAIRQILLDH